jgi:hypothetical protein
LSQSNEATTGLSKLVIFFKKISSYELVLSPRSTSVSKWTNRMFQDMGEQKTHVSMHQRCDMNFLSAWIGQTGPTASLNCLKHQWWFSKYGIPSDTFRKSLSQTLDEMWARILVPVVIGRMGQRRHSPSYCKTPHRTSVKLEKALRKNATHFVSYLQLAHFRDMTVQKGNRTEKDTIQLVGESHWILLQPISKANNTNLD